MKHFDTYVAEWEKNAKKDAYWAVLTSPKYEDKEWDKTVFFQTGVDEINSLKKYIELTHLSIPFEGKVLDFGCGTGRLSQALSPYFNEVVGIDISAEMIEQAQIALPKEKTNIRYLHNPFPNLALLESNSFDCIYSNIVLQHIGHKNQLVYIQEFARVVKPGGWVIFLLPSKKVYPSFLKKWKGTIAECLPYRLKKWLLIHLFNTRSKALVEFDFEMNCRSEKSIKKICAKNNLEFKRVGYTNCCDSNYDSKFEIYPAPPVKQFTNYVCPIYFMQKK